VNKNFFKKTKPGENEFFIPEEKELKITCLDDREEMEVLRLA
jgi:hypothetical protein